MLGPVKGVISLGERVEDNFEKVEIWKMQKFAFLSYGLKTYLNISFLIISAKRLSRNDQFYAK